MVSQTLYKKRDRGEGDRRFRRGHGEGSGSSSRAELRRSAVKRWRITAPASERCSDVVDVPNTLARKSFCFFSFFWSFLAEVRPIYKHELLWDWLDINFLCSLRTRDKNHTTWCYLGNKIAVVYSQYCSYVHICSSVLHVWVSFQRCLIWFLSRIQASSFLNIFGDDLVLNDNLNLLILIPSIHLTPCFSRG